MIPEEPYRPIRRGGPSPQMGGHIHFRQDHNGDERDERKFPGKILIPAAQSLSISPMWSTRGMDPLGSEPQGRDGGRRPRGSSLTLRIGKFQISMNCNGCAGRVSSSRKMCGPAGQKRDGPVTDWNQIGWNDFHRVWICYVNGNPRASCLKMNPGLAGNQSVFRQDPPSRG